MTPSNGTSFPEIDFSTAPCWGADGPPDFHAFDASGVGFWYWGEAPSFDEEDGLWHGEFWGRSQYTHDSDIADADYWKASLVKRPIE